MSGISHQSRWLQSASHVDCIASTSGRTLELAAATLRSSLSLVGSTNDSVHRQVHRRRGDYGWLRDNGTSIPMGLTEECVSRQRSMRAAVARPPSSPAECVSGRPSPRPSSSSSSPPSEAGARPPALSLPSSSSKSSSSKSPPLPRAPVSPASPSPSALHSASVFAPSSMTIAPSEVELASELEGEVAAAGCTFNQALLNAVNILLGVGLLSIPFAMAEGGWAALATLGLLGVITNYTGKVLGECQQRLCLLNARPAPEEGGFVRGLQSYEDIGDAAFGAWGRRVITGVLYVELVGTCGLFFILEGDNLARLFGGEPDRYMLASALALIPTTWLPDLSALAGLGALGAAASLSVLGVILTTYCQEGFPAGPGTQLLNLQTFPLTFGLLAFVYAGHAVFPNIKASMKEPELYPKMLDVTYLIVGAVCTLIGVVGYQMYGSEVMEEVTLNLPSGALAMLATALIVVNPFTKFALTMDPVARGLEGLLGLTKPGPSVAGDTSKKPLLLPLPRILGRTALGGSALFLATSVPFFGSVMALIGSSLTLAVSVIFPSLAYLKLFGPTLSHGERYWNYFVVGIGIVCAVAGTYVSLESLS
ncbi:Transmembrane amino acid transporter family protein [Klebsormidium nitens]|uniref:Transmembrane amino acid transporter family protein n=1 Tax=Klebsormidium nitens TaxID=105231 RepID=A0A0U9HTN7_KLENI|nr:Transmembrane amino acid transporter family protein [Klebsormidium nitens]|eukprot:GAQ90047.1 Transmembrane amino acid transporter family protein [Klebsormidium nitens]